MSAPLAPVHQLPGAQPQWLLPAGERVDLLLFSQGWERLEEPRELPEGFLEWLQERAVFDPELGLCLSLQGGPGFFYRSAPSCPGCPSGLLFGQRLQCLEALEISLMSDAPEGDRERGLWRIELSRCTAPSCDPERGEVLAPEELSWSAFLAPLPGGLLAPPLIELPREELP